MNWQQLLTSPPPATGWLLDGNQAAIIHRDSKGEFHCAAEALQDGTFEVGPVGLQSTNEELLIPVLAKLKGAAEGVKTAAVIVPTGWMRSYLIESDQLPRKQAELQDVVRWKLKKLLPVSPTELRLSLIRLPEAEGPKRVLCLAGVERAIAGIETSFKTVGVEPGLITTRLFALAPGRVEGERTVLVVQHETALYSFLLLKNGVPQLLRTKLLPLIEEDNDAGLREIGLTLRYIRENLGVEGDIEVALTVDNLDIETTLRRWLTQEPNLVPAPEESLPLCSPSTVADRLGAPRLAPVFSVFSKGLW